MSRTSGPSKRKKMSKECVCNTCAVGLLICAPVALSLVRPLIPLCNFLQFGFVFMFSRFLPWSLLALNTSLLLITFFSNRLFALVHSCACACACACASWYVYIHTLHYITLHYIALHYITSHYITIQLPVVPHKAVAEVSKIGNL